MLAWFACAAALVRTEREAIEVSDAGAVHVDAARSAQGMLNSCKKVLRMHKAYLRLGGLAPTDFSEPAGPASGGEWAAEHGQWAAFAATLLPVGQAAQPARGWQLDPASEDALASEPSGEDADSESGSSESDESDDSLEEVGPSCATQALQAALARAGSAAEVPPIFARAELEEFHATAGLVRLPVNEEAAQLVDVQEGAVDVEDTGAVGWEAVRDAVLACTEACSTVVLTPRLQSLVFGVRSWINHRGKLVPQLLVHAGARGYRWLDFRTLQDMLKLSSSAAYGAFQLRGAGGAGAESPPPENCLRLSEPTGMPYSCTEQYLYWKSWRSRAAAVAPTDFNGAVVNGPMLRHFRGQTGPVCGAASVANVLNALLDGDYVDTMDVLQFYSARSAKAGKVRPYGVGRNIYKNGFDKDDAEPGANIYSTARVGSSHIQDALQNAGRAQSALSHRLKRGAVVHKAWFATASANPALKTRLRRLVARRVYSKDLSAAVRARKGAHAQEEWAQLQTYLDRCARNECGVVFHLTNHYAPIYGYRTGTGVPQLLVPSAGQGPVAWMDWRSAREVVLGGRRSAYDMIIADVGKA